MPKILDDAARGQQAVAGPDPIPRGRRSRPKSSKVRGTSRKTSTTSQGRSKKIPRSLVTK